MDKKILWPVLAVLVIVLVAIFYPRRASEPPVSLELPDAAPVVAPETYPPVEPEPEPDFVTEAAPEPLPPLDESDAEARAALAERLALTPPWRPLLLTSYSRSASQPAFAYHLSQFLRDGPAPPTDQEAGAYIDRLVGDRAYVAALVAWQQQRPQTAVGLLIDGAIVVTEYADRKMTEGFDRRAAYSMARWIRSSVALSMALVESSKIRMRGSVRKARARAMRCRCPPDRVTPRSPTSVS